jgi:hypothetical protein
MGLFDDIGGWFGGGSSGGSTGGGWFDDVIGVGGALFDFYGKQKAREDAENQGEEQAKMYEQTARANAKLSMYDAEVARLAGLSAEAQADYVAGQTYEKVRAVLSTQTARYAKSGVVPGTGTPLEVEAYTAREAASEIAMIKYNGQTAKQRAFAEAEKYKLAAENGLYLGNIQASLAQMAGSDRADAYNWESMASLFSNTYKISKDSTWF